MKPCFNELCKNKATKKIRHNLGEFYSCAVCKEAVDKYKIFTEKEE